MQVSQIAELDTHAVIGGGKAKSFEMSDSAEFFTVLSDTLYRDKKRAVCREPICNAWDAHVLAGVTDRPIDITLNAEELIIKDFGPGIADDRIVPIYCRYGASTKVKDEKQTGGFGLGSKAPFAYTDHFTVTSCHNGFRTVYAISRGGAETEGKPDIRVMVKVPTTETGLTVSIPLKDDGDRLEFQQIIKSVIYQGGMLARFNDSEMAKIDYTEARKLGFCLIAPSGTHEYSECQIYVLYGTVLYPLSTTNKEIRTAATNLEALLCSPKKLILIASPNSVGVTPSREALSFSEMTIGTILSLIKRAQNDLEQKKNAALRGVLSTHVQKAGRYGLSYSVKHNLALMPSDGVADAGSIMRVVTAQKLADKRSNPELHKKICIAASREFRDSRRIFRRAAQLKNPSSFFEREAHRHSARLVLRLASKFALFNQLHIYQPYNYDNRLLSPRTARDHDVISQKLIIAPSKKKAYSEAQRLRDAGRWTSNSKTEQLFLCLILPRSTSEQRAEIVAYATKLKLTPVVLDFHVERRKPAPAQKLLYSFSALQTGSNSGLEGVPTLTGAKYFVRGTGDAQFVRVNAGMRRQSANLMEIYPEIALALNPKQEEKLRKHGAISVQEALSKELQSLITTREVQYDYLMREGEFVRGADDFYQKETVPAVVSRLARTAVQLSKLLFPDRVAIGDKARRAQYLLAILADIEVHNPEKEPRPLFATAVADLKLNSAKTFKHLIILKAEAEKQFAYLDILKSSEKFDKTKAPELCDLIRFLKRQHEKVQTKFQALKEAA